MVCLNLPELHILSIQRSHRDSMYYVCDAFSFPLENRLLRANIEISP